MLTVCLGLGKVVIGTALCIVRSSETDIVHTSRYMHLVRVLGT